MRRPAWLLLPAILAAQADLNPWQTIGYTAETRHEGCRGASCTLLAAPEGTATKSGAILQTVSAAPLRGRKLSLAAWIKVEGAAGYAQMFVRVLRPEGQLAFYDNMGDRPIGPSGWQRYEIDGEAAPDAQSIEYGVYALGQTRVWIDGLEFGPAAPAGAEELAARREIEALYARIDAATTRGDTSEMTRLALPDAQLVIDRNRTPLATAVEQIAAQLRKGVKMQSRSTVTALRMANGAAVVSVNNDALMTGDSAAHELLSINRDTWTRTSAGWRLKETVLVSSRAETPRTDAETTRAVAQELKQHAALIDTSLDAFGAAVGDARIVALGEATHGTSEFYTLNQRLLEYLVRRKGFTVLAIEANWPESLAVDRYIKNGQGDPRKALAGMNFWTWYTQEMLDLVEWMRAYNHSPGPHPILTFTSFDMQFGHAAGARAIDYLEEYAPDLAAVAKAIFADAYDLELVGGQPDIDRVQAVAAQVAGVAHEMDTRHRVLTAESGEEKWRDARQAAAQVLQACTFRMADKGGEYREEAMAANAGWIAGTQFPQARIVLWAHNAHVRTADGPKSMGAFLRERFGRQYYALGYAFRRGGLRAKGPRGGTAADVAVFDAPPSPEGTGDAVLSAAELPLFFLDFARVPAESPLGRWLATEHLFHRVGSSWFADDPNANLEPDVLRQQYDSLIFVEQGHAARPL